MSAIRRVWVTRAEPGAARTAVRLTALGFEPLVAPVLAIRPLSPAIDLTDIAALAFTSVNGVAAFAARIPERDRPVFTVGDATAQAARDAGFTDVRSAAGDIHALAALIAAAALGPVLAPGAAEPAGDLAALLEGKAEVRALAVYEAVETDIPAPAGFDAVLVHSPRASRALAMHAWALDDRLAVAISAAAAALLEDLGLREIRIASAPTEAALLQGLGEPARHV
ncbi:MAG: uroporphyrinogen-III synthase [Pseudomonadota bacterium]